MVVVKQESKNKQQHIHHIFARADARTWKWWLASGTGNSTDWFQCQLRLLNVAHRFYGKYFNLVFYRTRCWESFPVFNDKGDTFAAASSGLVVLEVTYPAGPRTCLRKGLAPPLSLPPAAEAEADATSIARLAFFFHCSPGLVGWFGYWICHWHNFDSVSVTSVTLHKRHH